MNFATLYGQNILVLLEKLYGWQNGTRQHYLAVCYGEHIQSVHFNTLNLAGNAWANQQSVYAQLSPLYLLSILFVTHIINYSWPSPLSHVPESWAGPGNKWYVMRKTIGQYHFRNLLWDASSLWGEPEWAAQCADLRHGTQILNSSRVCDCLLSARAAYYTCMR